MRRIYDEKQAARVTVRLNGELIHDDFKLSLRRNKYAAYPEEPLSHIVLQEHGSASEVQKHLAGRDFGGQTMPDRQPSIRRVGRASHHN